MTEANGGVYTQIYRKLYQVIPNLDEIEEAAKLKAKGFMDLNVDILRKGESKGQVYFIIALSHYYRHESGDMIADPDMEIRVYPESKMAEALTYQDAFGYRVVYPKAGYVDVEAKAELNEFLSYWLDNLMAQGHKIEVDSTAS